MKKKKSAVKVVKRKSGIELWWQRTVKSARQFVAVGRWVVVGAVLMWIVLEFWK